MEKNLILASSSPRRVAILNKLNIPFEVIPADIDESTRENEIPAAYVERLAIEKARKISQQFPTAYVIGSDLTCDLAGCAIGKAHSETEARVILQNFSGKVHYGRCGFALLQGDVVLASGMATAIVTFKNIAKQLLEDYITSKKWIGLAGAYGVQNNGRKFMAAFSGSYYDITGLPIYHIVEALQTFGFIITPESLQQLRDEDNKELARLQRDITK